jgi:acyl-coenzyme A synthetase/AMP-(fatty) acid ligase
VTLSAEPGVNNAALIGVSDPGRDQKLVAAGMLA